MIKHGLICLYAALRLMLFVSGCSSEMTTVKAIKLEACPVPATAEADSTAAQTPETDEQFRALVQDALQLYRQQDYDQAVESLREAVALHPDHWEPFYVLGLVRTATEQYAVADAFLTESLDLAPPDDRLRSQIHLARAHNFEAMATYGRAAQSYQMALNLHPELHAAREGLQRLAERTAR